jgi:quercetin dioxygenase-like cupin family protein
LSVNDVAHDTGQPDATWFLHDLVVVHVRGSQNGGRYALVEVTGPAGDQPPPHVHREQDEGFYVLEGELTLYTPDAEVVLGPGEFLNAVHGVPHSYRVTSPGPARWLVAASPAGFEEFVEAFGEPAGELSLPPPSEEPPDVDRLVALAAEHGIDILGPPGMLPRDLPAS